MTTRGAALHSRLSAIRASQFGLVEIAAPVVFEHLPAKTVADGELVRRRSSKARRPSQR